MNPAIPALSLREPWCWSILHLGKNIENRSWSTRYSGPIRLHASRTWDADGSAWLLAHGYEHPTKVCFELAGALGAYVGEVEVVDCRLLHELQYVAEPLRRWAFGPVCWLLENPVPYADPIPGRGYPGLYYPERFARSPQP